MLAGRASTALASFGAADGEEVVDSRRLLHERRLAIAGACAGGEKHFAELEAPAGLDAETLRAGETEATGPWMNKTSSRGGQGGWLLGRRES